MSPSERVRTLVSKVSRILKTQNVSGRQFGLEKRIFFPQLAKELFVLLVRRDNGRRELGRIFAVAGMPQANLLFLAGLPEQVAMPFLLPGNTANSFSRKFRESFLCMIRVQKEKRLAHAFKLLPEKGESGFPFSLGLTRRDLSDPQRTLHPCALFFYQPGRRQKP